jgi:hypothetical protein
MFCVAVLLTALLLPAQLFAQGQSAVSIIAISTDAFPKITTTVRTSLSPEGDMPPFTVTLKGKDLPLAEIAQVRVPVMVSVVADLSDGMRADMAPGVTRLDAMQVRLSELIWRLQAEPTSMSLVLVGDTVVVAHEHSMDLGGVDNTVANGNPTAPFSLALREAPVSPTGSLIQDGLVRGLSQLDSADLETPQVLVLFASGDAWQTADLLAFQPALTAARSQHPIELLIVGFGGATDTTPLREAALQLGATYIHQNDNASVDQKAALNAQYAALAMLGHYTRISAIADRVPPGNATLQIALGEASTTQEIDVPPHPPEIVPLIATDQLQDIVRIGMATTFSQSPITSVSYLLDGHSLNDIGQIQKDNSIVIDTSAAAFQQQYQTDQPHELVVAATDAQGQESRSAPMQIAVIKPSQGSPPLGLMLAAILVVLAIIGVTLWLRATRIPGTVKASVKQDTASQGKPGQQSVPPKDDDTLPQRPPDEEKTMPQGNRGDSAPSSDTESHSRQDNTIQGMWRLEFLEGATGRSGQITPANGTHYEVGRPHKDQEMGPTHIAVLNNNVSRGAHAILNLNGNGTKMLLKANNAVNPVYLGANRERELPIGTEESLEADAIFWLSNTVKIRVVRER